MILAKEIVARFHSISAADNAWLEFRAQREQGRPTDVVSIKFESEGNQIKLPFLLASLQLCVSQAEARRVIAAGGVRIDGVKVANIETIFKKGDSFLLQKGKIEFRQIEII